MGHRGKPLPDPNIGLTRTSSSGRTVEKPGELKAALDECFAEPGPYLLNVKVTPFENVFPMVPAGGAINEMVLGPPKPVTA